MLPCSRLPRPVLVHPHLHTPGHVTLLAALLGPLLPFCCRNNCCTTAVGSLSCCTVSPHHLYTIQKGTWEPTVVISYSTLMRQLERTDLLGARSKGLCLQADYVASVDSSVIVDMLWCYKLLKAACWDSCIQTHCCQLLQLTT